VTGSDPQGHLFGTQAIIRAAEQFYAATSGPNFRQAIYWAAFRQELWISLMTQRAFQLHIFPADRSFEPADDSIWATRTIAHLGDVCNFAFGEDRHSIIRYNQLVEENRSWRVQRPDSFDPFFYSLDRDGSGRCFPDIRFHEKTHGECLFHRTFLDQDSQISSHGTPVQYSGAPTTGSTRPYYSAARAFP
jgi:hypothetical protein